MLNLLLHPHYKVEANYEKTIQQLIAEGKYKTYHSDGEINDQNFYSLESGVKRIDVYLVKFGFKMIKSEVIKEFGRAGLRPLGIKELLSLGSPVLQQHRQPIIGLDSKWRDKFDHIQVPEIYSTAQRDWYITLDCFDSDTCGYEYFAGTPL